MEGRPVCLIRLHAQWQDLLNHWIYFHTRKITQHNLPDNPLYTFKTKASNTIHIFKLWIKHHFQCKKTHHQPTKIKTHPHLHLFSPGKKQQSANQNQNTTTKKKNSNHKLHDFSPHLGLFQFLGARPSHRATLPCEKTTKFPWSNGTTEVLRHLQVTENSLTYMDGFNFSCSENTSPMQLMGLNKNMFVWSFWLSVFAIAGGWMTKQIIGNLIGNHFNQPRVESRNKNFVKPLALQFFLQLISCWDDDAAKKNRRRQSEAKVYIRFPIGSPGSQTIP